MLGRYQANKVMKKQVAKERKEQESAARSAAIKDKLDSMTAEEKDAWQKRRQDVRQVYPRAHVCSCTMSGLVG